jgi:hypothetical protein
MTFDELATKIAGKHIFVSAKSINMYMSVDEVDNQELEMIMFDRSTGNSLVFYPYYTIKPFQFEDMDEEGYAVYRGSKLSFYITIDNT